MDLQGIKLDRLKSETVAILGYGNQGRNQALNLRDGGIEVLVGARTGKGFESAKQDGFLPLSFQAACEKATIVMLLLPDLVIPEVYKELTPYLAGKQIGLAHGYAFHYGLIKPNEAADHFLAAPIGAGAILREGFLEKRGFSVVCAQSKGGVNEHSQSVVYAKAIGANEILPSTFQTETEVNLFAEQVVLCGGVPTLMEEAVHCLIEKGVDPKLAYAECCTVMKVMIDLYLKHGPQGMRKRISPTAFFGALTRGKRLISPDTRSTMDKIWKEIQSGQFKKEWQEEVDKGSPQLAQTLSDSSETPIGKLFERIKKPHETLQ